MQKQYNHIAPFEETVNIRSPGAFFQRHMLWGSGHSPAERKLNSETFQYISIYFNHFRNHFKDFLSSDAWR